MISVHCDVYCNRLVVMLLHCFYCTSAYVHVVYVRVVRTLFFVSFLSLLLLFFSINHLGDTIWGMENILRVIIKESDDINSKVVSYLLPNLTKDAQVIHPPIFHIKI